MKNLLLQLALLSVLVTACTTERSGTANQNNVSMGTIANKQADTRTVEAAIRGLGPVIEPAAFWAEIANDVSYPLEHRRKCVFALFRRHVHKGMSLAEVARKLDHPNWLPDENIHEVKLISGLIPLRNTTKGTIFVLIILPPAQGDKSAVYLRVAGKIDVGELGKLLRGEPEGKRVAGVKLDEIGFSER